MFLTYPPCNTPCCIKAMCSPISKSGLLISLFCTPYFGLWAFYVNQLLRCIYVGLTRNSKMMTRPRTKYRILQRSLSINNIYSAKQVPKKTRQNFRSKYKPTNWLQKDKKITRATFASTPLHFRCINSILSRVSFPRSSLSSHKRDGGDLDATDQGESVGNKGEEEGKFFFSPFFLFTYVGVGIIKGRGGAGENSVRSPARST